MASNDKEELLKLVKDTLRSVLIPSKEGIPARTISRAYDDLACAPLPYRQLGYSTCEEFIKAIPDVVRIGRNKFGEPQLFAVASEATAHIVNMVKAQRNRKVRTKRPVRTPVRRPYNHGAGPPPRIPRGRSGYPVRTYNPGSAYSRPPSRPIGKPFSKPSHLSRKPSYNSYSASGSRLGSQSAYKAHDGPSVLPYKDFAVTVQSSRRDNHNTVQLSYDTDDPERESESDTGQKPRVLKSVVVKPTILSLAKMRSQNPSTEDAKFGDRYEVPPRFRQSRGGRGEKENALPSGFSPSTQYSNLGQNQLQVHFQSHLNAPRNITFVERGHMYKKLVADYCKNKGLPSPNYDLIPLKMGFVCSVHVGTQKYGSIEPYQSRESAEEAAAMNACQSLNIEKGLYTLGNVKTEDESLPLSCDPKVKERIIQIIKNKVNGIWLKRISVEYNERYREDAPANLLRLLQSWTDQIKLDKNAFADTYIVSSASPKADIQMAALFPLREKVAVYMSYLSGDGLFYVQRSDTEIDNINEDIQSLSAISSRLPGPEVTQGAFCVAKYAADNTWCRAQVLQYTPGTDVVHVLFVDYGNEEQIPLQSIRKLNPKLCSVPAQCVKCELYGVHAWEGDLWTNAATDKFAQLVGNIEVLAITIAHTGKMCEVELYASPEDSESVNEVMVRKGLLKPMAQKYLYIVPDTPEMTTEENVTNQDEVVKKENHTPSETSAAANSTPGEPGPVIFPEEGYWNIYVSFLTSINDITFRLVGENYSDLLEELEVSLEECYMSLSSPPSGEIEEGSVCVASVDSLYHRVRVLELNDNKAKCYFLDHGDRDEMHVSKLRLISPQYNTLPYQACHCGLAGLDVSNESLTALASESLLNYVLGKTLVAEVVSSYGHHHSVILYDTSGEEDININDAIAKLTTEENAKCAQFMKPNDCMHMGAFDIPVPCDDHTSVASESSSASSSGKYEVVTIKPKFLRFQTSRESAPYDNESVSSESSSTSEISVTLKPKLLSIAKRNNSYITNQTVTTDTNLTLAIDSGVSEFTDGGSYLELQPSCQANPDPAVQQPSSIDPAILDQFSQGVNMESLASLSQDKMSLPTCSTEDTFSVCPEDIPLPESCSELSSMSDFDLGAPTESGGASAASWNGLPSNDSANMIPLISNVVDGLQAMDIYAQGDGAFPLATDISGGASAASWNGQLSNDSANMIPLISNVTDGLQAMDIYAQGDGAFPLDTDIWSDAYLDLPLPPFFEPPPVEKFIDVHIRWVSDPENFVCLPYASLSTFAEFMEKLGEHFHAHPAERSVNEVTVGHLYAGVQCGIWYRVIVKDFLRETDMVCVLFADIGEFDVLSLKDLQPLPVHFWRFPFQSFRAKLFGVRTNGRQWSEACKFKFQELVANKNLVALVKDKDEQAGVYSLSLVDTSTQDQDIDINEVFASKLISWLDN